MSTPNVINPFAGDQPTVGVVGVYNKPVGIVQDPPIVPLPDAPVTQSISFSTANLAAAITGLSQTLNLSLSNNITTFNAQEVLAMQNTLTLLSGTTAGTHSLSRAQLQDIMVSVIAVNNSANTGAYVSPAADFANNNVAFGSANTGWFPDGAQTLFCQNQYMVAEMPGAGTFAWSNTTLLSSLNGTGNTTGLQGGGADWSVLNTADMEDYSDQPLAADGFAGQLVIFGIQSIQFYTATGGFPEVFLPVLGTTQNYGLAAVWSRAQFQNSIAFLGQNRTGQVHVFKFNGYTPQIISDTDIDTIINSFPVVNDATAYSYDQNGHQFYQITFPTAGRSFLYDGTTDSWSEVMSGVMNEYGRHVTDRAVTFNTTTLAGDCATGNVYIFDATNPTDGGFLVHREFTTKHLTLEGNRFVVNQLWLDVNTGAGSGAVATQVIPANTSYQNTVIVLNPSTIGGACNYTAYNNSQFGIYGTVAPGTVGTSSILFFGEGTNTFGSAPGTISLLVQGHPGSDFIDSITYTDRLGNVQTFSGASADFETNNFSFNSNFNTLGTANSSSWTWTNPEPYTSFGNSNGTLYGPFNVTVHYKQATAQTLVTVPQESIVQMYWSTDNGNTWKGPRNKSLGAVGQYNKRLIWRRVVGGVRDVTFKFVTTAPIPITFIRVNAVVTPGSS